MGRQDAAAPNNDRKLPKRREPQLAKLMKNPIVHPMNPLKIMGRTVRFVALAFACSWILNPVLRADGPPTTTSAIDFNRQIRPILSDNCFACHGPDESARKAKLQLDLKDAAFKGGKSGDPSIVPGKPDESELIKRITSTDPDEVMPPPKSKKQLSQDQIALLKRWVQEGAPWQSHWAFEKPQRPPLPSPKSDWGANEIDRFILQRLEKEGLKPSPPADPTTLIRRASLDLTGLPPTVEEVESFLQDSSNDRYEKLVARLMASTRYGEHMAKFWLDSARYADSHGYHIDSQRDIWPYREWVIRAFNQNIPFNQFGTEQLAGDLLPNSTVEQKIASGYVRCNMSTGEGGAIEAEYLSKYTFDRTETTATIFMGLTLTCARCHTHKYDPITHREYYGLYSFFHNLNEPVMDGNKPNPDPFIQLATPEQKARQDQLKHQIADGQKRIERAVPELDSPQLAWQTAWHHKLSSGWTLLPPSAAVSTMTNGAALKVLEDSSLLAEGNSPVPDHYEITLPLNQGKLAGLKLETFPHSSLPLQSSSRADDGRFQLSELEAELVSTNRVEGKPEKPRKLKFAQAAADSSAENQDIRKAIDGNTDTAWSISTNSITLPHRAVFTLAEPTDVAPSSQLRVRLKFEGSTNSRALGRFRIATAQDEHLARLLVPRKQEPWRLLGPFKTDSLQAGFAKVYEPETTFDLNKSYPGVREEIKWNVRADLEDGKRHLLVHELHGVHGAYYFYRTLQMPEERKAKFTLHADDLFKVWVNGQLVLERSTPAKPTDSPAEFSADLRPGENKILIKLVNHQGSAYFWFDKDLGPSQDLPADVAPILAATDSPLPSDLPKVRDFYRREHSPEFKQLFTQMEQWRGEQAALEKSIPTTMVAKELDKPRDTFILMRGEYDKPGEKVSPGVPSVLPPLPKDSPTNRLGLAHWLFSLDHPLTARVIVNRFWQQFFGTGLVKTAEDFGVQGEQPSHPELLDWLATEFIRSGWDLKRLQRLLVTSATYQQSARLTPDLLARDPENRLLARGPRFRVDAETLRDMALYFGGLLVERPGGHSVKPFEPPGLWEAVSFNNSQKYVPDQGEGQYRRSLYTYWKRQSPPPSMLIFDAPTREYCVVRRPRTNTPLQALALLNDPQVVEASRALAQRIMLEGGSTPESRLSYAFQLVTARKPHPEETQTLRDVLDQQIKEFQKNKEAADKLLSVGSHKAKPCCDRSELAAWTTIATMLINLDETITKG